MRRTIMTALTCTALLIGAPSAANAYDGSSFAIGSGALAGGYTGTQSTAVGTNALAADTTGSNNTGLGYGAGRNLTTGYGNTAVGTAALYDSGATAAMNVAVGLHAGRWLTGSGNVAIGADVAGTAASLDETVMVGHNAYVGGYGRVAIGSGAQALHTNSVALGRGTTTTGADQVAIGARDLAVSSSDHGLVLTSPNGTRWRLTVTDGGALVVTVAP